MLCEERKQELFANMFNESLRVWLNSQPTPFHKMICSWLWQNFDCIEISPEQTDYCNTYTEQEKQMESAGKALKTWKTLATT